MTEPGHFESSAEQPSVMTQGAVRRFTVVKRCDPWLSLRQPEGLPRVHTGVAARSIAGAEQFSTLGKFAFGSLWLLVFAMPWEDAFTISGFGTSVRLIG